MSTQCLGYSWATKYQGLSIWDLVLQVGGLGVEVTTPPHKNCQLGNKKCGLETKVWRRSIMETKGQHWAVVPMKKIMVIFVNVFKISFYFH